MSLHDLIGHEALRSSLVRAHQSGTLPAALLLHGPRGVGKQRLALWIAQLTVCAEPIDDGPCEACGPCRMTRSLEHPDVHWYFPLPRPKAASKEKLAAALEAARFQELAELRETSLVPSWSDDVRGLYLGTIKNLRTSAAKRPTMAEGPVFIVGQSELLVPQEASPEAANALLKLLEEPPGQARFILTSSEPGMLLPTIRSRTVPVHVPALPRQTVKDFLAQHLEPDEKTRNWAAHLSQGSPGRAMAFLPDDGEPGPLEALRRRAFEIVTSATASSPAAGYRLAASFPPARARQLIDLFTFVEEWLRDLAAAAAGADDLVINYDALGRLKKHAGSAGIVPSKVPEAFPAVERARELARGNVNPQLVVSGLVRDLRGALLDSPPLTGTDR
ncbi:MAG: hypothetical protein OXU33_10415 [Gemmatimonadota bacterium]|nr:hypothetical protein [Gemmatimonadota bacterium]MDE3004797.1 hypothetical protein [Gemmatimonadota bacterium]MDE3014472.1 hypothetical protein [Gemmatimonadota bacterium]